MSTKCTEKNLSIMSKEEIQNIELCSKTRAKLISALGVRRLSLKMSQGSLAKICNLERTTIVKIEHQKIVPSFNTLILMAHALGMQISITPLEDSTELPLDCEKIRHLEKMAEIAD